VHFWDAPTGSLGASVNVGGVAGNVSSRRRRSGCGAHADGAVLVSSETGETNRRFIGHTGATLEVDISQDGRLLERQASIGRRNSGTSRQEKELRTLSGHGDVVTVIAFSPSGQTVATGSRDRTVRLWDSKSGEQLAVLEGHTWYVLAVAFSPDGKLLATGGSDGEIKLWDVERRVELSTIRAAGNTVLAIEFSSDGKLLCVATADNMIGVWSVATGQLVQLLRGHADVAVALAIAPGSRLLASASKDGTVRLWDLRDRAGATTFEGQSDWAWHVAYSPNGRVLASASKDGSVILWEAETHRQLAILPHPVWVNSVAFSHDGRTIGTGSDDGLVRLWNAESGELIATLHGHPRCGRVRRLFSGRRLFVLWREEGRIDFLGHPFTSGTRACFCRRGEADLDRRVLAGRTLRRCDRERPDALGSSETLRGEDLGRGISPARGAPQWPHGRPAGGRVFAPTAKRSSAAAKIERSGSGT
jgi:WD40 repeat protein